MILLETNKGHYKRNFGDVFLQDPVLLARLITNYFANKGFIVNDRKQSMWNHDLSKKHGGEGRYKAREWSYDWSNQGVLFRFKETEKDEWPEGSIQLGIKEGYAITKIHTRRDGKEVNETYKISLNKTVLELCQSLVRKYRTHLKGNAAPDDVYQSKSIEKRFVKLYQSKGFDARFDGEREKFYIWTMDQNKIFSDPRSRKLIQSFNDREFVFNLALKESIEDFIKVTTHVINRYAKMGYALSDRDGTKFWANSSEGITLDFRKSGQEVIDNGIEYFKRESDKLRTSENVKTKEEYADMHMRRNIVKFFEDQYKQERIIQVLEHI